MSDVEERVLDLLSEICEAPRETLTPELTLLGDLAIDSVVTLDLLIALEENFEIEIGVAEATQLETVGDVLACVREHH